MSVRTCFLKTKAYFQKEGKPVSEEFLRDMARALEAKQADSLSAEEFRDTVRSLYSEKMAEYAAANRAARVIALEYVERAGTVVQKQVPGQTLLTNLLDWANGGSWRNGEGLMLSTTHAKNSMRAEWQGAMKSALGDRLKIAESGLLDKEIHQEMSNIEKGGKVSVSGSHDAYEIARVYHGIQADIFNTKSAYDPFLSKISDYLYRQTHDRVAVTAAGEDAWVNEAVTRFGKDSFPEMTPEEQLQRFQYIFQEIRDGTYGSAIDRGTGGDLMKKMAQRRTLIPNSWEDFYEYNQKFGNTNLHQTMMKTLDQGARDISILQKFGPKPKEGFDAVVARAVRLADPEEAKEITSRNGRRRLENAYAEASYQTQTPATSKIGGFTQGALAWQSLAKAGWAYIRAMPTIVPAINGVTDRWGGNFVSNFADITKGFLGGHLQSAAARASEGESLWLFSNSFHRALFDAMGDKPVGFMSKTLQTMSHLGLVDLYHTSMANAVGDVISRHFGDLAESEFKDLPPQTQQGFKGYGIGPQEWDLVIRKATQDWSGQGDLPSGKKWTMVNVDAMKQLPDKVFQDYVVSKQGVEEGKPSVASITRARNDLNTALGSIINDHADMATHTPTQSQRRFLYQGTDINSGLGATLRFVMQFKGALTKNFDSMMRSYYSNPEALADPVSRAFNLQGDWMKIARHVGLTMGAWVMADTMKTLIQGKTPEDPTTVEYILKALGGSGAAGILGDTLMQEIADKRGVKDIGEALLRSAAGPGISTGVDAAAIALKSAQSTFDPSAHPPTSQLGKLLTDNIPGQNFFYLQGMLHFYLLNGLREAMGPGYLGNLERSVNQHPGILGPHQEYWIGRPTESPH